MYFTEDFVCCCLREMNCEIGWNCDFCGKSGIIVSAAGVMYCRWCRMSYGEQINLKTGDMDFDKIIDKKLRKKVPFRTGSR